jgi:hypothetical protein
MVSGLVSLRSVLFIAVLFEPVVDQERLVTGCAPIEPTLVDMARSVDFDQLRVRATQRRVESA